MPEYYFEAEGCWISEWWNTPEDEAVSVARVRVERGVTTKRHSLSGITERYLVLSGRGEAEIGGEKRQLGAGDTAVIAPGVAQRITNTGESDLAFLAVCTPRFRIEAYRDLTDRK